MRATQLSFDLRHHLFGEELHLVDELVDRVGGEIEPQQVGHAGLAVGNGPIDHLCRRADQVDVLVTDRALLFQRRLAQRDQMLVHLALAEALERRLSRLADMDDELWTDIDRLRVAAGLFRSFPQRDDILAQALHMHAGRQPAVAPGDGAADIIGVVAADIDRDACLVGLRPQLDIAKAIEPALEACDPIGEEGAQRLQALVDDVATLQRAVGL